MAHEVKLGEILEGEQFRDAIHIAVAPVIAAEKLAPGQDIGFIAGSKTEVGATVKGYIGIVDPYLKKLVFPGQQFYMFLYPQTITSLRHEWTHPAFETNAPAPVVVAAPVIDVDAALKRRSREWMERFAKEAEMPCEDLLKHATAYLATGNEYVEFGTQHAQDAFYRKGKEFWRHFEILTGLVVPEHQDEDSPFSCSC